MNKENSSVRIRDGQSSQSFYQGCRSGPYVFQGSKIMYNGRIFERNQKGKSSKQCWYCKFWGHLALECSKLGRDRAYIGYQANQVASKQKSRVRDREIEEFFNRRKAQGYSVREKFKQLDSKLGEKTSFKTPIEINQDLSMQPGERDCRTLLRSRVKKVIVDKERENVFKNSRVPSYPPLLSKQRKEPKPGRKSNQASCQDVFPWPTLFLNVSRGILFGRGYILPEKKLSFIVDSSTTSNFCMN